MSTKKALLVIDVPEHCEDCPCFCERIRFDGNEWHNGCNVLKLDVIDFEFHESCPLKPVPEKLGISLKEAIGIKCSCYSDGWNDCIDEILGEEE